MLCVAYSLIIREDTGTSPISALIRAVEATRDEREFSTDRLWFGSDCARDLRRRIALVLCRLLKLYSIFLELNFILVPARNWRGVFWNCRNIKAGGSPNRQQEQRCDRPERENFSAPSPSTRRAFSVSA
jgi:hypothetical protein